MRGTYFHYVVGEKLAAFVPKGPVHFLARVFTKVYARWFSKDMSALIANMTAALPKTAGPKEIRKRAEEVIVNFSSYLVDFFYMHQLTLNFIKDHVEIRGKENIDQALSQGKGVILASAHLGNWEMGGMTAARLGYPVYGLAVRHKVEEINKMFERRRDLNGLKIIFLGQSLKNCFRVLKKNEILALNADRIFGEDGVPVNFMGKKVAFPRGISRLSHATGAPVLPAFFTMKGGNQYMLDIQKPLEGSGEDGLVQSFALRLEEKIKQVPTQWFIFQRFWEAPEWPI